MDSQLNVEMELFVHIITTRLYLLWHVVDNLAPARCKHFHCILCSLMSTLIAFYTLDRISIGIQVLGTYIFLSR